MCELHNTLFCLPLAHHPLLLLPFAGLQATKLFFSAHTVLAVVSLALPFIPSTGVDPNVVGGLWIPVPILPHGMKHIYRNTY